MDTAPLLELNDGRQMPVLGFGTYSIKDPQVFVEAIETGCPVHILQGMADPDVPYGHAIRLMEHLSGDDVVLTMIRDGDHRLSRPQDIAKILEAAEVFARAE